MDRSKNQLKFLNQYWELNPLELLRIRERDFSDNLILLLYFFILSYLIYKIILFTIDKFRPAKEPHVQYNRRRIGRILFAALYIIAFFPIIFSSLSYLPTILGLAAAGIVISLKEVWLNGIGWITILGSNGFRVGDRIEIDGIMGDVVNIGLGKFTLLEVCHDSGYEQSTNRLVHFPNHTVILKNYFVVSEKMNFVWDEFRIRISLNSDWEKAERICNEILQNDVIQVPGMIEEKVKELSKNYLLRLGKHTPIVYTVLEGGHITLSLRYLTPIRSKRLNRIIISKALLKKLHADPSIHILEDR